MHKLVESITVGGEADLVPSFGELGSGDFTDHQGSKEPGNKPHLICDRDMSIHIMDDESSVSITVVAPDASSITIAGSSTPSGQPVEVTLPGNPVSSSREIPIEAESDCHREDYSLDIKTFRIHNVRLHTGSYYSRTRAKVSGGGDSRNLSQWDPYEHEPDVCITICNESHPVYIDNDGDQYHEDVDSIEQPLYGDKSDAPSNDDWINWGVIHPGSVMSSDIDALVPEGESLPWWATHAGAPVNNASDSTKADFLITLMESIDSNSFWFVIDDSGSTNTEDWESAIAMATGELDGSYQIDPLPLFEQWMILPMSDDPGYTPMVICDESTNQTNTYVENADNYRNDMSQAEGDGLDSRDFHIIQPGSGGDPVGSHNITPEGEGLPDWVKRDATPDKVSAEDLIEMTEFLLPPSGVPDRVFVYYDTSGSMTEAIEPDALEQFQDWVEDELGSWHHDGGFSNERWVVYGRPGLHEDYGGRLKLRDPDHGDWVRKRTRSIEHNSGIPGPARMSVRAEYESVAFVILDSEDEPVSDVPIRVYEGYDEEEKEGVGEVTGDRLFGSWWTGGPMQSDADGKASVDLREGRYYYTVGTGDDQQDGFAEDSSSVTIHV